MKVTHIYKNYYPITGGIEGHIRMLCSQLVKDPRFEPSVLVTNTGKATTRELIDGISVTKAGENLTLARTPISWRLWSEIAKTRPDIAHLHFPYPFGELGYLLFGKARRLVLTYHSDIVSQKNLLRLYEPFLWRFLQRADRIIVGSPPYVDSSRYLRRFKEKCIIIPFGNDVERFRRAPEGLVAELRQRYGTPLILFVGKFRYYKGLRYLIAAMAQIQGQLVLVGQGPLEDELRRQVWESGLGDRVHFAGEISDAELPAYYHACDLFVLPAAQRSEAFGAVQLEAMAAGKPIVCTEIGTGTSWVNVNGETGLVVEPAEPAALASAINLLLADEPLRRRFGEQARQRVLKEFTLELMGQRTAELYAALLQDAEGVHADI